jgi:gliding motility-associated-like protein
MKYKTSFLRLFLSCCLLLLCCRTASAQYENVWALGYKAGIDFNSGTPVAIQTAINGNQPVNYHLSEGSASVCDANGALLFYTDGSYIWDKTHNFMPNGQWLAPVPFGWPPTGTNFSTTNTDNQNSVIVPMPGDPDKYYVFSKTRFAWPYFSRQLYYSVVDMTLNGGLGDVISNQKSIFLDSALMGCMIAIPGNDCNVWLVTRKQDYYNRVDSFFQAFEITASGVNHNAVMSTVPNTFTINDQSYIWGRMAVSPDRTRIADTRSTNNNSAVISGDMGLYNFDPSTGLLSNETLLSWYNPLPYAGASWILGVCFSPDNSKLYMSGQAFYNGSYQAHAGIYQFDLSSGIPATIMGSMTYVAPMYGSDLKIGPDNKVYYNNNNHFINGVEIVDIGRIALPNLSGLACNPQPNIVSLLPGTLATRFSNTVVHALQDTVIKTYDTAICNKTTGTDWQINAPPGNHYLWDDGSATDTRTILQPGTYWVSFRDACLIRVDTYHVSLPDLSFSLGPDSVICNNTQAVMLQPGIPADAYRWQDGSTNATFKASADGEYWVYIRKSGCMAGDTIKLTFRDIRQDLGRDTVLCKDLTTTGEGYLLQVDPPGQASLLWSTGNTTDAIKVTDPGTYWIQVSDPPCIASDTVHIDITWCDCRLMMPSAFSPNRDGLNDFFLPVPQNNECRDLVRYTFSVYNRWGQLVYQGRNGDAGWNGSYKGQLADVGTYYYYLSYHTGINQAVKTEKGDITLIR